MEILIISYYYYPEVNPRSIRWNAIINYFSDHGHKITIVTVSPDNQYHQESIKNIKIIRIPENWLGRIRRRFGGLNKNNRTSEKKHTKLDKLILAPMFRISKSVAKYIYFLTIKNIQWPDHAWSWIYPTKRRISQIIDSEETYDVLITVSHPFSSHIIGRSIKKNHPEIFWIMDKGDPFSFLVEAPVNNFYLYRRLNHNIESKFLKESDAVTVTTEETKFEYENIFPHAKNKIKVIPPLLNPEAVLFKSENKKAGISENHPKDQEIIRLAFVGTLYNKIRNPKKLLKLLNISSGFINKKIKVDFYGPINDLDTSSFIFPQISIKFHGHVHRKIALNKMWEADVLINIGNTTTFQLPSKLIEYASMSKPILNISSVNGDSSTKFLSSYPLAKNIYIEDLITDDLIKETADYLNNVSIMDLNYNETWLNSYTIENIAKEYESLFI